MRTIPAEVLDQLASEAYRPTILLRIESYETILRFTSWDYPIFWNNCYLYEPRGFRVNTIKYGTSSVVDNVSIKFDDVDRALYTTLASAGSEQANCTIRIAVLDANGETVGYSDVFIGDITEWFYSAGSLSLKVSSVFSQWATVTTSTFSGSCRWRIFKGKECAYSGEGTSCDRTYVQCERYENTDNFGGFRFLQSLEGKTDPAKKQIKYWVI